MIIVRSLITESAIVLYTTEYSLGRFDNRQFLDNWERDRICVRTYTTKYSLESNKLLLDTNNGSQINELSWYWNWMQSYVHHRYRPLIICIANTLTSTYSERRSFNEWYLIFIFIDTNSKICILSWVMEKNVSTLTNYSKYRSSNYAPSFERMIPNFHLHWHK